MAAPELDDAEHQGEHHASGEAAVHPRIGPPVLRRLQDAENEDRHRTPDRDRAGHIERWCVALTGLGDGQRQHEERHPGTREGPENRLPFPNSQQEAGAE